MRIDIMNNCIKCNAEIIQGSLGRKRKYCNSCAKQQMNINSKKYQLKKHQVVLDGIRE